MFHVPIRELVLLTLMVLAVKCASAEEPEFYPGLALRAAVDQIEREPHLVHRSVGDDLSKKWLMRFLERLDPRRMYFLAEDIALFRASEHGLDDLAKAGSFVLPRTVRTRYRERVAQTVAFAGEWLDQKHEFTVDESCPTEFRDYATSDEELRERWRLRIKLELLTEKANGRPLSDAVDQLQGRYRRIARQASELSDKRLCDIYIDSLAKVCDPNSSYQLLGAMVFEHIPSWSAGLRFREAHGRLVLGEISSPLNEAEARAVVGWELLAIRRYDGSVYDVVEMPLYEVIDVFQSILGPLKKDERVILELLDPVTHERRSVEFSRLPEGGSLTRSETVG